jgi:LuxR family maltose regulon positive regulatory protein
VNLFGRGPSILITLEPHAPDPFSPETLRERFGFSRQEARVARLLAEGHRNKQIARTLGLSARTVRHYLERIFQKLEVRSRAEVVSRILRE